MKGFIIAKGDSETDNIEKKKIPIVINFPVKPFSVDR
jgi:hypothetical protein